MVKRYGIVGYPLTHTLSPRMHNRAFAFLGLEAVYEAYPVPSAEGAIGVIREVPLQGASVTIPHKEAIIEHLDGVDEVSREIGAVNTVLRDGDALLGTNTDWEGFLRALKEVTSLRGKEALILGAGGAARAAAYALVREGATFTVTSRTLQKAERVAADFGGKAIPWEKRGLWEGDVIVNATPLGSKGERPLSGEVIGAHMVVMDMVYSPRRTPLLEEASRRGAKVVEGLRMLLFQGARQLWLWLGLEAPEEVMWEALTETSTS